MDDLPRWKTQRFCRDFSKWSCCNGWHAQMKNTKIFQSGEKCRNFSKWSCCNGWPAHLKNMKIFQGDCRMCAASRRKHPPLKSCLKWQMCGDKEFLSFISGKWNGSRHLVFWSLGTLTGLRDRVWRLIA